MSLAVVDASVLVVFYVSDDPRRGDVISRLGGGDSLYAPAHLNVEVVSALRGLVRAKPALATSVPAALQHLAGFPIRRMPSAPFLERMWELRANLTAYDAAYVALAEQLGAPVVTCDARSASASGARCTFDVIT